MQADARGLAIEAETYDLIVAKNVLHFFRGSVARDLVDRCTRALRPDGMLLLETFTIHDPSFEAVRSRQWSEVEPRSFVDPSSSQERSFVADGELLEWARNRGLCVVAHYESIIHDSHPPEGPHEHGVAVLAALRSPEG